MLRKLSLLAEGADVELAAPPLRDQPPPTLLLRSILFSLGHDDRPSRQSLPSCAKWGWPNAYGNSAVKSPTNTVDRIRKLGRLMLPNRETRPIGGAPMSSHVRHFLIFSTFLMSLAGGCLSRQVARDGVNLRGALTDMYTDQIMDNLIRAHDNLPFVQVTFGDVTVQDNDQYGTALDANQSLTEQLFEPIQRIYATMFAAHASASRSRTMSFVSNPVTDQNDIYTAYLEFAKDPTLFVVTKDDPGCVAHIVRKHCKKYYWIPVEAAPQFLDLAMRTTFMRGPEAAPPGAYEVTITAVTKVEKPNLDPKTGKPIDENRPGDLTIAYLTFSATIPSGDGTMVAKLTDGRTVRLFLKRVPTMLKDGKEVPVRDGEPTTDFRTLAWSPKATGFTENDLVGAKARVYSNEYPPDAPVPLPRMVQRIKADTNFLRNQQAEFRR